MFTKKILITFSIIFAMIMTLSVTSLATPSTLYVEDGVRKVIVSPEDLERAKALHAQYHIEGKVWAVFELWHRDELNINYSESKNYRGEIIISIYNDTRELIIEEPEEIYLEAYLDKFRAWVSSDEYTVWLEDGTGHFAKECDGSGAPDPRRTLAVTLHTGTADDTGFYTVIYNHYESEESQEPFVVFKKRISHCRTCYGMFQDYLLTETDFNEMYVIKR